MQISLLLRCVKGFLLLLSVIACGRVLAQDESHTATQDADGILKFYERYPQWRGFYPVGVYTGVRAYWPQLADQKKGALLSAEFFFNNHVNAFWDTNPHTKRWPNAARTKADDPAAHTLDSFGKWMWGELAPAYGFKVMAGFSPWLGYRSLPQKSPLLREQPFYTEEEIKGMEAALPGAIRFGKELEAAYPQTLLAFITDDEPHHPAVAEGAYRFIKRNLTFPPITCNPNFSQARHLGKTLQPYAGDWYLGHNNCWSIAPQMRWMNENYPGLVMHAMLWTCGSMREWNEAVLPQLRDDRSGPEDLRVQIWQCVALGAKGIWAFLPNHSTGFFAGGGGLTDSIIRPDPVHGNMAEWARAGKLLSEVGPLLLSCRSEMKSPVAVKTGIYERKGYFTGPSVDHGWLKDLARNRYYLVPWNNNTEAPQAVELSIPAEILDGSNLYDLTNDIAVSNPMPVVAGDRVATIRLTLEPGGGKIILIASEGEFSVCRQTVLDTRLSRSILTARNAINKLKNLQGDDIIEKMEESLRWGATQEVGTAARIAQCAAVRTQAEQMYLKAPKMVDILRQLDAAASDLSRTEKLLRSFVQLLGIPFDSKNMADVFKTPGCGTLAQDWFTLASQYLEYRHDLLIPEAAEFERLLYTTQGLMALAEKNRQGLERVIAQRLEQVRRPYRLALLTSDQSEPANAIKYTWAYQTCHVDWYAPDGKGGWRGYQTQNTFDPRQYDVVWIHQDTYAQASGQGTASGDRIRPNAVLMPELLAPGFLESMRDYQKNGGGLLLTGVAGLYAVVLGMESTLPDQLQPLGMVNHSRALGLVAAVGYENHPLFLGFPKEGILTAGSSPQRNCMVECAWKKNRSSGHVIAHDLDSVYGADPEYAAVVEYESGAGKTLVLGGLGCIFTPSRGYSMPKQPNEPMFLMPGSNEKWNNIFGLRERIRRFILNSLDYLADRKQRFRPDATAMAANLVKQKEEREAVVRRLGVELPRTGWLFALDPADSGVNEKWFDPTFVAGGWKPIETGLAWEAQGYDYDGYAWYRNTVRLGNNPGQRTLLRFGAVDEVAVVYLDGKPVGTSPKECKWDEAFELDITDFLTDKETEHLLVIRVFDQQAAGGIWKPISVRHVAGNKP